MTSGKYLITSGKPWLRLSLVGGSVANVQTTTTEGGNMLRSILDRISAWIGLDLLNYEGDL